MEKRLKLTDHTLKKEDRFHIADLVLKQGEQIVPHRHDFYEFYVVLKGKFTESFRGAHHMLLPKQAHILGPDDDHCLYGAAKESSILRNIAVERQTFEAALAATGQNRDRLGRYFWLQEGIYAAFLEKSSLAIGACLGLQQGEFILQSLLSDMLISGLLEENNDHTIPLWLRSAYRQMQEEENFTEGLPRLLALTGKSQEHITRAFQRFYGETPSDYVNRLRLQHAAWLLQTGEEKVIDILYRCGFNNVSYFNRLFKKRYGLSPREYRESRNFFF